MQRLEISYDRTADVLYISIGEPRPGIATEYNDGDFIRVDPATNEVVGITLLDFCERFIQSGGPGAITPRQLAKRIKRTGERIVLNKAITEE